MYIRRVLSSVDMRLTLSILILLLIEVLSFIQSKSLYSLATLVLASFIAIMVVIVPIKIRNSLNRFSLYIFMSLIAYTALHIEYSSLYILISIISSIAMICILHYMEIPNISSSLHGSVFIGRRGILGLKLVLPYTLLLLLNPYISITLTLYLVLLTLLICRKYYLLKFIDVVLSSNEFRGIYGKKISIPLHIASLIRARIYVEVDGSVSSLDVEGEKDISIDVSVGFSPYQRYRVVIYAEDIEAFSIRKIFEDEVIVKAIPQTRKILEEVYSVIKSLEEYIGRPAQVRVKRLYISIPTIVGGPGIGLESGKGLWIARSRYGVFGRIELEELANVKSIRGEFYGVKDYTPGDDIRSIHWKKSISKNKLVVREFVKSPHEEAIERPQSIDLILCDLRSTLPEELSTLVQATISMLLLSRSNRVSLILVLPERVFEVQGGPFDVLRWFIDRMLRENIEPLYRYRSRGQELDSQVIQEFFKVYRENGLKDFVESIDEFTEIFTDYIVKSMGIAMRRFTMIHSAATSFIYSILRDKISSRGFEYVAPTSLGLKTITKRITEIIRSERT